MRAAEVFIKPGTEQTFKNMGMTVDQRSSIGAWSIVAELPNALVITDFKVLAGPKMKSLWIRKDNIEGLSYIFKPGPNVF